MNSIQLSSEYAFLVQAARVQPTPEDFAGMSKLLDAGLDWEVVKKLSDELGMAPLLYRHFCNTNFEANVPEDILNYYAKAYLLASIRNTRIHGQFHNVLAEFERADIPVIALKGIYLGPTLYGDTALRPLSDIDLLCRRKDLSRAAQILSRIGYTQEFVTRSAAHERSLIENAGHLPPFLLATHVPLELHFRLFPNEDTLDAGTEAIWSRTVEEQISGHPVRILSPVDQLLFLVHHLHHHFEKNDRVLPLYWFCDIHEWISRFGNDLNWTEIVQRADVLGMQQEVSGICRILKQNWHTPVPDAVLSNQADSTDPLTIEDYLDPLEKQKQYASVALGNIRREWQQQGIKAAAVLLFGFLFPSRAYLVQHYQIKKKRSILFYRILHTLRIFRRTMASLFL